MSRKEIFDNKQVILFSLTDDLRNYVHSSIRLYLAKNSGNIHLTSRVDLDNCHFYNLCHLIFKTFRSYLSEAEIDLFYKKKIVDGITVAVKFCSDIKPHEFNNYYSILHDSFREVFEDNFIRDFSFLKCLPDV